MIRALIIISVLLSSIMVYGQSSNLLMQARQAMQQYDFTLAATKYSAYQAALKKEGLLPDSIAREENSAISRLRQSLESVEDIVIFDSIAIPLCLLTENDSTTDEERHEAIHSQRWPLILNHLNFPDHVGKFIVPHDASFINNPEAVEGLVYITPDGNTALWAAYDSHNKSCIYEAIRLTGGEWIVERIEEIPSPAYSPFLMDDGMTLYYTTDNYQALGSRDIMMSTRDAITEPWRQPQNIGMPYNSPFDELLYVVDAIDNIGMFVTTRNYLYGDSATIYYFIPAEIRHNLSEEESIDVIGRARISSISATWPENFNPVAKRNLVKGWAASVRQESQEFTLYLPDGKMIYKMSEIKSEKARRSIKEYLDCKNNLDKKEQELKKLYDLFGESHDASMNHTIKVAEEQLDYLRLEAEKKLNRVYRNLGYK